MPTEMGSVLSLYYSAIVGRSRRSIAMCIEQTSAQQQLKIEAQKLYLPFTCQKGSSALEMMMSWWISRLELPSEKPTSTLARNHYPRRLTASNCQLNYCSLELPLRPPPLTLRQHPLASQAAALVPASPKHHTTPPQWKIPFKKLPD